LRPASTSETASQSRTEQERKRGSSGRGRAGRTGERLDEHVEALVAVLVPAGGEHVERVVEVKVEVTVEVTSHELVDLLLGHGVHVLELVHGRELVDVEAVGRHAVCERGREEGGARGESGTGSRARTRSSGLILQRAAASEDDARERQCTRRERDVPGLRLRRCSASYAVMCDTVVKTSAQWAAERSMQ